MSEYVNFVKSYASSRGIKYNDALRELKSMGGWKAVRDGNQGNNISIDIEQEPDIFDAETDEEDLTIPEEDDPDIFDAETEDEDEDNEFLPDEPEEEPVSNQKKSRFSGKNHPYYKHFKHIRDRERQKGGDIWGDIWNGVASVLKPALGIFGGPIGAAASALVPTITDKGVKMAGIQL
jgi:hypothetical protein